MAFPYDTYDAMTQQYWPTRVVEDNIHVGTPTLKLLQAHQKKEMLAKKIEVDVLYGRLGGGWIAPKGEMTLTTADIASKATWAPGYAYVPVELACQDVELNEGNNVKIASLFDSYVTDAIETMREVHLAPAFFGPQSGLAPYSLHEACNDTATYGGILTSDMPTWVSMVAEADYSLHPLTAPISPSVENVKRMIRAIADVCGKKPSVGITTGAVWDVLADQVSEKENMGARMEGDKALVGFDKLWINDVEIVHDPFHPGDDFVADSETRAEAAGHQMSFVNWGHTWLLTHSGRSYTWDKMGWVKPRNFDIISNILHWWGVIVCNKRKANGRMFGIDPTQKVEDWTTIDLTAKIAVHLP